MGTRTMLIKPLSEMCLCEIEDSHPKLRGEPFDSHSYGNTGNKKATIA